MVSMQGEDAVHGAFKHGVDHIGLTRCTEHHAQEIARVGQIVLRVKEGLTDAVFVSHGHQGGHLGNQANGRHFTVLRVVDVSAVVIEGRQSADQASQYRHRVRISAKATQEKLHLLVHHGVVGDGLREFVLALCVG